MSNAYRIVKPAGTFGRKLNKNNKDCVFAIIYSPDSNTVLVESRKSDNLLGFIGGKVESTDNYLIDALAREVKEEVNLDLDTANATPFTTYTLDGTYITSFLYPVSDEELDRIIANAKNSSHFNKEIHKLIKLSISEKTAKDIMTTKEFSGSGLFELKHFIEDVCKIKY